MTSLRRIIHKQVDSTRGHVDPRTQTRRFNTWTGRPGDKTRSKKESGKGILLVVAETRIVCM